MSFFKKVGAHIPHHSPKYQLHKALTGFYEGRSLENMHASSLTNGETCPRMYALADVTKAEAGQEWLKASEAFTYEFGRTIQELIVNHLADAGIAWGHWKCLACATVYQHGYRPERCEECGCLGFKPEEVRFTSKETGQSAGIDCLLRFPNGGLMKPLEIKTQDKDVFKGLVAPLAEHRERSNLYLRTIEESDDPHVEWYDTQEITVLYVSKGTYGVADPEPAKWGFGDRFSPFKEFVVQRDDSKTQHLVDRAKIVKRYRAGEIGMPCGICPTALTPTAQKCVVKKACFSGEFPPEYDWKSEA